MTEVIFGSLHLKCNHSRKKQASEKLQYLYLFYLSKYNLFLMVLFFYLFDNLSVKVLISFQLGS